MAIEQSPKNSSDKGGKLGEAQLVWALKSRDERAFEALLQQYQSPMLRLARCYTSNRAVAEEIVQEAWLGLLKGLERFEARSSLKTFLFAILVNRARTRARQEWKTIPFSSMEDPSARGTEPLLAEERFLDSSHGRLTGHWASDPESWGKSAEKRLLEKEALAIVESAIAHLPPEQQEVIVLRDIEGWTSNEVCNVLGVSETYQRVLLHRARSKVRLVMERHFAPGRKG